MEMSSIQPPPQNQGAHVFDNQPKKTRSDFSSKEDYFQHLALDASDLKKALAHNDGEILDDWDEAGIPLLHVIASGKVIKDEVNGAQLMQAITSVVEPYLNAQRVSALNRDGYTVLDVLAKNLVLLGRECFEQTMDVYLKHSNNDQKESLINNAVSMLDILNRQLDQVIKLSEQSELGATMLDEFIKLSEQGHMRIECYRKLGMKVLSSDFLSENNSAFVSTPSDSPIEKKEQGDVIPEKITSLLGSLSTCADSNFRYDSRPIIGQERFVPTRPNEHSQHSAFTHYFPSTYIGNGERMLFDQKLTETKEHDKEPTFPLTDLARKFDFSETEDVKEVLSTPAFCFIFFKDGKENIAKELCAKVGGSCEYVARDNSVNITTSDYKKLLASIASDTDKK